MFLAPLTMLLLSAQAASPFNVQFDAGEVVSLRFVNDAFPTEYIAPDSGLGELRLTFRSEGGSWASVDTKDLPAQASGASAVYTVAGKLSITNEFEVQGQKLLWRFKLKNLSAQPLEIGDLATPLPMNGRYSPKTGKVNSVLKHSFISGDGSFLFWMRPNSVGPFLMLTPMRGTAPEYWDAANGRYQIYVRSKAAEEVAKAKGTRWRIPQTGIVLAPGATSDYGYTFQWAKDYQAVRDAMVSEGQVDVQVVPGMTVPSDLEARIALRSALPIHGVEGEFPESTKIRRLEQKGQTSIYRVTFSKLGENRLTVNYGNGLKTYLEFFSTEPVETLINKRGAFLARCRYRDPSKWYDGLISEWNMETQTLLGPDNYDRITGWRIYEVSCDDPGLGKPAFLAAKNAEFPVQPEVDVLDDYIQHFVWGGLQQTTSEPYPYGIYGIPDWKTLRESKKKPHDGVEHIWRVYDYPHIVLLYASMYRLAANHPEIHTRLTPIEYLKRAYGTAEAMYTVPAKVDGWSAYETGYYNELVILNVIDALETSGLSAEAAVLRKHWEDKVRFFVTQSPDLFGSEYAFDSTGFESTEALGRYAMAHYAQLGFSETNARKFLDLQIAENVFCRGSIEPAYYYLGSDYRGGAGNSYTLSYMSQMGGWGILDYGLHYAADPASYLRLGYASYLSSWALMNTGTAASNYGYWYPGEANDGGAGGGFEPAPFGKTWLDQPHHRGSWYYGGEIDLGYSGALRTAATVVTDDPIFGRICLGGSGRQDGGLYRFIPKDGLRRRIFVRTDRLNADLVLDGARFASGREVSLGSARPEIAMPIEGDGSSHLKLTVGSLSKGAYEVRLGNQILGTVDGETTLSIPPFSGVSLLVVRLKN